MRDTGFIAIETERLRLRRFAPADVRAFHAYRVDPDVARFQSWQDYTIEQARGFVEEISRLDPGVPGEPFQVAVARRHDDVLVGDCMLALDASDPPNAEIGYTLAPAHQGLGYATEAASAVLDLRVRSPWCGPRSSRHRYAQRRLDRGRRTARDARRERRAHDVQGGTVRRADL